MSGDRNIEIEARFLEIDKPKLLKKLKALGAKDLGEELLEEVIFYDKARIEKWWVRLRKHSGKIFLTYKNQLQVTVDGTEEVEFEVKDFKSAKIFLEKVGLVAVRIQEKKRHTFVFDKVTVDIDTWPKVPTYVELEASSEALLRKVAKALDLDWSDAFFEIPRKIIETRYGIPVSNLSYFTFKKIA